MTITYDVIDKKTNRKVIDATTKHCFTDRNLKPVNLKKKNEEIYNLFKNLESINK